MRLFLTILALLPLQALAQETLETIEVSETNSSFSEFWEENKDTKIFSGKKNTVTSLKEIPQLQTNNYRQATSQTPGLLISEVPNESLAAITYRGLGDPHESYNLLLLQDGIPVAADMFGYPAHYYSPALPMMDKVQFIRGGASLLYGPQPAGALNYISRPLGKGQKGVGQVNLTGGPYNLLTTNNAYYGSKGNHTYGVEYYRRQGDGPQRINSNFEADYVQIRNHTFKDKNKYKLSFNGYNSDHGEPGGFSKTTGANTNPYGDDLGKTTKRHDRLKVSRAQLAAGLEHRIDESSRLDVNLWAFAYNRYSKRQRGGGFGTFPTGADANTNDIVTQKYYGLNGDLRYLKNYTAFGNEHTLSVGYMSYNLDSPLTSQRGPRPDANSGQMRVRADRFTRANSYFAENRFAFGKLMVTPGVRFENIHQEVDERKNLNNGRQRKISDTVNVPLFGVGVAYHTSDETQVYLNASEAYKPVTYAEALPSDSLLVSNDVDPSKVHTAELGYRGQTSKLNWDISAFFIRYENKFGQLGSGATLIVDNTGAGEHQGIDLASELKLGEIFTKLRPYGNFNFYANTSFLEARYTRGSLKDKTPMYAPKNISRLGLIHGKEQKYKVAIMSVFVSRHFGDDNNTDQREIPFYTVFDLTADYHVNKDWMISGGINNLLDRHYYSRVRPDGIAWAMDRNYYLGATFKF
jgi:Fe(3+) dicitrate transport protein